MLAASALKEWLAKTGQPGQIRYYGCPAEEVGAAKSFMARASHASAASHLGRSVLDAVELMNVRVQCSHEHTPQDLRIHYAMLDSGGIAPNMAQAKSTVRYAIHARDIESMFELNARVKTVDEGAAIMTDTQLIVSLMSVVANLLGNRPLEEAHAAEFCTAGSGRARLKRTTPLPMRFKARLAPRIFKTIIAGPE